MDCRDFSLVLIVVVDGVNKFNAACYDVAVSRENLLTIRSWTLSFVLLMEVCFIATPESFERE